MSRPITTLLIVVASILIACAFATKIKQPILPHTAQPLRTVNILLDVDNSRISPMVSTSTYQSISTLSTAELSTFSTTAADVGNQDHFYPFGKNMYMSFQTQTVEQLNNNNDDETLLTTTALNEFFLEVDESPVFGDATRSSGVSTLNVDGTTDPKVFMKHTSFKGKRVNANGADEELFLTILPASGDYVQVNAKGDKSKLETQQLTTLDISLTSGRSSTQYTIEGYLLSGDKTYHIASYATLQSQVMTEFRAAQQILSTEPMVEQEMAPLMDTLNTLIDSLAEQRQEAAYDLAIVELKVDRLPGDCGTAHHHHHHHHHEEGEEHSSHEDDEFNPQTANPLSMTPSWILRRWRATCNPLIGRVVVFSVKVFASWSYQVYASGSTIINDEVVAGRTKILLQIINNITQQQLGFVWKLGEIVQSTENQSDGWNAQDTTDSRCKLENLQALEAVGKMRPLHQDVSALHALVTCSSVGVVGIAGVDVLCTKTTSNCGVSSINGIYSWTTFGHELQHQVGANHPFGDNTKLTGTFGGLMDYYNIRLPKTDPTPGRYGFNQNTDSTLVCAGLQSALNKKVGSVPDPTCYSVDNRDVLSEFCGNGIVEPWEECDSNSVCCSNCKLAVGATCGFNDATNECCVSCTAQASKRCSVTDEDRANGLKNGACSVGGQCLPLICGELSSAWSGNNCPDTAFFSMDRADKCGYVCPDSSCSRGLYSARTNFETGSPCKTASGQTGICVDTEPFNVNQQQTTTTATCVTEMKYSWKYTVVAQCDCKNNLDLIDAYTCVNNAGAVVSSSFCANEVKPDPNTCCCSPPCAQDYVEVGGDPNTAAIASTIAAVIVVIAALLFLNVAI